MASAHLWIGISRAMEIPDQHVVQEVFHDNLPCYTFDESFSLMCFFIFQIEFYQTRLNTSVVNVPFRLSKGSLQK